MRPLQLAFSGIRSYPGNVGPLDFVGKTRIAIVGDTGAGKSTILEAISLALYGNCTWTDREHRALMADGVGQMTADLTFAHDGQRWRVRRIYHANTTPSSHLLENLETGEQTDGKRAVNAKVEALLQLTFTSFATAVLLPQGKFDRLLTATGAERTGLLKSIFGVQIIETVRARTGQHRDQLSGLVHRAELARRGLLDDPAGTAALEATKAVEAARIAGQLQRSLGTLQALRTEAFAARERRTAITAALEKLKRHKTRDAAAELARVSAVDLELSGLEASAAQAGDQWTGQRGKADEKLAAAAAEGFTAESLASAATLLDALPGRVAELAANQEQLDTDEVGLALEAGLLAEVKTGLAALQSAAESLAQADARVSAEHQGYRGALGALEDAVRTALHRAADAGKAQYEEDAALRQANELEGAIAGLETAAEVASRAFESAEDHLGRIRSQDAAHTAGSHLAPGEPCLICRRVLPDDYEPPAPSDPEALNAAELSLEDAKAENRKASDRLADAKGRANSAQQAYTTRQSGTQTSQNRLEQARRVAVGSVQRLAGLRLTVQADVLAELAFEQTLEMACSRLIGAAEEEQDELLGMLLVEVLSSAVAVEQQLSDAARRAGEEAGEAKAAVDREADIASVREKSYKKEAAALESARERHRRAVAALTQELTALPALLRKMLPGRLLDITPEQAQHVRQAVTQQQDRVAELTRLRDEAIGEIEKLAEAQRQLDLRRRKEISGPLHSIATYLERWQDALEEAVSACPGDGSPITMPARVAADSVDEISSYAAALPQAGEAVTASLSQATEAAVGAADMLLKKLHAAADRLRAGKADLPVVTLPEDDELLEPSSLDALVSAQTTAHNEADRHQAEQRAAEGQVQRAASLDAALRDGNARLNAVDALRGLLADAKFLQYLTDRRTRALLAVASETFGTLSSGEFGFGEDFQIISRRSGAARSPKTLSGGETFLASLALALALVELHSRSGGRLGALFLDEGFASLDVDSLAGALAVLQAETGGDKLVAVVSHLHAVAEAAEDVLWVERGPAGSTARWLNAGERDALVHQEVTGGLLNLL